MSNQDDSSSQHDGDISMGNVTNSKAVAVGTQSQAIYVALPIDIGSYLGGIQAQTANEAGFSMKHKIPPETLSRFLTSLSALVSDLGQCEDVPLQPDGLEQFAWSYPSPDVPRGWVNLGGAAFQLREKNGQAAGWAVRPSPQNKPEIISIPVGIDNVSAVFMLITAGWGLKRIEGLPDGWEGEQIGIIRLLFGDGSQQEQPLVLGDNIRDWAIGNTEWAVAETTDLNVFPVWISPGGGSAIDLLRIDVNGGPKTLEKIEIIAHMVSLKGQTLLPVELRQSDKQIAPASFAIIQVSGITCRVRNN